MDNNEKKTSTSPNSSRVRKSRKPRKLYRLPARIFKRTFRLIISLICIAVIAGSLLGTQILKYAIESTNGREISLDREDITLSQTTFFYAQNPDTGDWEVYDTFSSVANRIWVDFDEIPDNLKWAFICTEDKDFYESMGVSFKRTFGAAANLILTKLTNGKYTIYDSLQGASTIEQQLIKNITGDNETDPLRKIREILSAMKLSNQYSKDTILEYYLNIVPLTGTIAGVEAGAQTYFGKHVSDLSLAECASIASITKNPSRYSPYNTEEHKERRDFLLYNMYEQGKITESEYNEAINTPVKTIDPDNSKLEDLELSSSDSGYEYMIYNPKNTYFTDAAFLQLQKDLMEQYGYTAEEAINKIYTGGLRVYLTIDTDVQSEMDDIMKDHSIFKPGTYEEEVTELKEGDIPVYLEDGETLKTGKDKNGNTTYFREVSTQASMVTMSPTGEVKAISGGIGEKEVDLGVNRATDPHQTGSSIKPIGAYALAFDYGLVDEKTKIKDDYFYTRSDRKVLNTEYCIKHNIDMSNYEKLDSSDIYWRNWPNNATGGVSYSNIDMHRAIYNSYNTIAVKVGSLVGPEIMYDWFTNVLGFEYFVEQDKDYSPLCLGSQSYGVTGVELASAYQMFYDGQFTEPKYYSRVIDAQGNEVLNTEYLYETKQVIKSDTAETLRKILEEVITKGTARGYGIEAGDMPSAAKTGTTQDYKALTYAGMTPYYITSVWYGYDTPEDMSEHLSNKDMNACKEAWKELMERVQDNKPSIDWNGELLNKKS